MRVHVIGLGNIGGSVLDALKGWHSVSGSDIDPAKCQQYGQHFTGEEFISTGVDVYVVAVFRQQDIGGIIGRLFDFYSGYTYRPLISVESTVGPNLAFALAQRAEACGMADSLLAFPHRWNPGDPAHGVLNQTRVMGGTAEAVRRGHEFIGPAVRDAGGGISVATSFENACWSKLLENAYRFCEIAVSQSLCRGFVMAHGDGEAGWSQWRHVRALANTKWNIDIKEARDGIGGTCLPKDALLVREALPFAELLWEAIRDDREYQAWVQGK